MKEAASTENEVLAPQLDELADEIAQFLCLRAKILPSIQLNSLSWQ